MKELFVSLELAMLAKSKGFNEPCFASYANGNFIYSDNIEKFPELNSDREKQDHLCTAPTYQQIVSWFRDKHKISIEINWSPSYKYDEKTDNPKWADAIWEITIVNIKKKEWDAYTPNFQRYDGKQLIYESTIDIALQEAFKMI